MNLRGMKTDDRRGALFEPRTYCIYVQLSPSNRHSSREERVRRRAAAAQSGPAAIRDAIPGTPAPRPESRLWCCSCNGPLTIVSGAQVFRDTDWPTLVVVQRLVVGSVNLTAPMTSSIVRVAARHSARSARDQR